MELAHDEQSTGDEEDAESGAVYTWWGSHGCPDIKGTELVYQGRAAASYYSHTGGAANYLCLPNDPDYKLQLVRAGVQGFSKIYGVEYENPAPINAQHNLSVPCAVCLAKGRISLVKIPAKLHCPNKWTLEYKGILMSGKNDHRRTTFECVDEGLEALSGSSSNDGGGLFYNVEATCNGIDCPPYYADRELMCVVCTR